MEALHTLTRRLRTFDIRHNGTAFGMLGISLFALYSNLFVLVIIPLIWMGYRIGKEMGRQEAHDELTHATLASFSEQANR